MPTFRNDNNDEVATVEGVEAERLTELDNWHEVIEGGVIEPVAAEVVEPVVEPEPQPVDANGVLIPTPVEPVEPVEPVVA